MSDNSNPICVLIERFGGQNAMARAVGVRQSEVWRWSKRGLVPSSRIGSVIKAGARLDPPIIITPDDFFSAPRSASIGNGIAKDPVVADPVSMAEERRAA